MFPVEPYLLHDTEGLLTPSLVIYREPLLRNLAEMVRIAGSPARLRPHCKTHKMAVIIQLELERGVTKHKCATLAEAEMLANAGVTDIFLAYNPVGPNIPRVVDFVRAYPQVALKVTADHPQPLEELSAAMKAADCQVGVLLDLDVGMHRTGIEIGPDAILLYQQIVSSPGLIAAGLHVYDGHQNHSDFAERREAIRKAWEPVHAFREQLTKHGWPVPTIVCGGTGGFPVYAEFTDPAIELSPGTCLLHDWGYHETFPDLQFEPAAILLTRVVSRPGSDLITCDLGYKAIASDPPAAKRVTILQLPEAEFVRHSEEHLTVKTPNAGRYEPGDLLYAVPRHICPTVALHQAAYVAENHRIVASWETTARDRRLRI